METPSDSDSPDRDAIDDLVDWQMKESLAAEKEANVPAWFLGFY
jgi:hypothetical protein